MTILVTGGAGYIGSHTCVTLIERGHPVVIYDNFCNSHREVADRIADITGVAPVVVQGDVRDTDTLVEALTRHQCSAVIHFAGLKSVAESVRDPSTYYDNNVIGTFRIIEAMRRTAVNTLVFSSSATVYGEPVALPIREDHPLTPHNPYGRSKMVVEQMLDDIAASSQPMKVAILRYFNPVGSHESGLIGEDPRGVPNNLMPYVAQVAIGRRDRLNVYGNDYDTADGTGVRDYVHVMDLAEGHFAALQFLAREQSSVIKVNLGTGRGTSVLELVDAFSRASGEDIPITFAPRRDGDVARCYASPHLAEATLDWRATRNLDDMCRDVWRWQTSNPDGYLPLQANSNLKQRREVM